VAKSLGLQDVTGADGDYVDRSTLLIDAADFAAHDITKPFDAGRTFDLVLCLEVAEHVPRGSSITLIENIVRHGPLVLFSAAVPGQGGEDHVNEQAYAYWRDLFALRGYRMFDFVRPRIADKFDVEPWYRYNLMLFAHDTVIARLPLEVTQTRLADDAPIQDVSPWLYRLRKTLLARLPGSVVSWLAVRKHQRMVRTLGRRI
jgi:SAM-dependent methyltransferase